ncbi:hypothetical protein [Aeromonas veronii]|uniref:hypothetical protein n=1 Tax=Aeromonas veronii TaxID=654 RepID=UPI00187EA6BF|nr:hypothetical protein [Aeromonas veronii]MBE8733937.1 hypothetical protein [Aeromonas veronii]MBE8738328.1 hypothetical protein [Aeromonas veronii]MBE8741923.1 hypothetical protein [Aeromonas veronii]MBE8763273.1 hypothetical protein [Aeromonas veronii]MBE8837885.1 hypothetical protein [Aeromonas veronii]
MKNFIKENSLNLASIIIALCAVVLTVHQAYSTNYHNRISLLPLIQAGFDITDDGQITLYFENAGNGPAIVTGFESFGIKSQSIRESLINFLQNENIPPNEVNLLTTTISERVIIKDGDRLNIAELYLRKINKSDQKAQKIIDYLANFPMTICYMSLYQDELYATSSQNYVFKNSCAYKGAFSIFGYWVKYRNPFGSSVEQSKVFDL